MERFAREDVREVLRRFGVENARRATTTDATEEVILLDASDFGRVDVTALTTDLMEVLPHTKVWVAPEHPRWQTEPL